MAKKIDNHSTATFKRTVADIGLNPLGIDRLEKVCFHTLRHTYCSWLAMEGVSLHSIGKLVGHKTSKMTERYSHLLPEVQEIAAKKIEEKQCAI